MASKSSSQAVPIPTAIANGIRNASDQKATTIGFLFSHHSPATSGQIAIHNKIPANGMQYNSDKLSPILFLVYAACAMDGSVKHAVSIITNTDNALCNFFIVLRLLCFIDGLLSLLGVTIVYPIHQKIKQNTENIIIK